MFFFWGLNSASLPHAYCITHSNAAMTKVGHPAEAWTRRSWESSHPVFGGLRAQPGQKPDQSGSLEVGPPRLNPSVPARAGMAEAKTQALSVKRKEEVSY